MFGRPKKIDDTYKDDHCLWVNPWHCFVLKPASVVTENRKKFERRSMYIRTTSQNINLLNTRDILFNTVFWPNRFQY